jgi:hypothetical protein
MTPQDTNENNTSSTTQLSLQYEAPALNVLGTVAELTLGTSGNGSDFGSFSEEGSTGTGGSA